MVIVFDVMGTLLNPAPLNSLVRHATGGKMSAKHYFGEVTTYAMANSLSGARVSFETVASAVLEMSAASHGMKVSEEQLMKLRKGLRAMPPFNDVRPALRRLHDRGLRLAALSNANTGLLQDQLKRARLTNFFEAVISIEEMSGQFKPAIKVYESALERLGGHANELLMVAAHPWDLMGAARAGYRTALIRRQGKAAYPGLPEANHEASDLMEFADQLLGERTDKNSGTRWLLATAGVALGIGVACTARASYGSSADAREASRAANAR